MNVAVIVNPTAGRGRGRRTWEQLKPAAAASGHAVEAWETRRPGDATGLAAQAAAAGIDRVIALGGDGTLYETVNGLVGTASTLGVIPAGTGNDFCKPMGIPTDPEAALAVALGDYTVKLDVGRAWDRFFLNSAGIGFDAEVCRETNAIPKYFGGTIPYLVGVVKVLVRFRPRPVTIDLDGEVTPATITLLAVGNGQYYGGGMRIAPNASLTDGLFDIITAGDLTLPELLAAVPRIYSGSHLRLPKVGERRGRRLTVTSEYPLAVHLDGEVAGTLPVTIEILPAALEVAAPPGSGGGPASM